MFCLFLKCMCMYIEIARVVNEHVLRIRVNVCMWVYEYMYIYTHIHLYTYIYIHALVLTGPGTLLISRRQRPRSRCPRAAAEVAIRWMCIPGILMIRKNCQ